MSETNNVSVLAVISGLATGDVTRMLRAIEHINQCEASLVLVMKEMKPYLESFGSEVDTVPRFAKLLLIANLIKEHADQFAEEPLEKKLSNNSLLDLPINALEMTVQTTNRLKEEGIDLVKNLVRMTEDKLLKTQKLGRKSVNEIKEALSSHGLSLGM